jgi:hypothetical protein
MVGDTSTGSWLCCNVRVSLNFHDGSMFRCVDWIYKNKYDWNDYYNDHRLRCSILAPTIVSKFLSVLSPPRG